MTRIEVVELRNDLVSYHFRRCLRFQHQCYVILPANDDSVGSLWCNFAVVIQIQSLFNFSGLAFPSAFC